MTTGTVHLAEILLARADSDPDTVGYEYVDEDDCVTRITYGELAARACSVAAELVAAGPRPAIVMYPQGLEYVAAVLGGFLAGVPVVPAYPSGSNDRDRLAGIMADAGIGSILGPAAVLAAADGLLPPDVARIEVPDAGVDVRPPDRSHGSAVAIIQYTSGSTGTPRGVMVRHDSVAANTAASAERFALTGDSRVLSWLPPFHDMGLIGGILTPLSAGVPVRLMAPSDFLKSPLRWLHQITSAGATVSGGPNFAYELCVRRARDTEATAGLDLSRWVVAFNGAEPVRRRTMADFADRFAGSGFQTGAFLPCYGLAEATLIVTAGHWDGGRDGAGPVDCGPAVTGQDVAVVDPDRACPQPDGQEGEIWVAGRHITPGYWTGHDEDLFGDLAGQRMLRTGDLGVLRDGRLAVTGRIKDVIVHQGVNYHAADIEAAALLGSGNAGRTTAAFDLDAAGATLVMEVAGISHLQDHGRSALAAAIRTSVLTRTGLLLGIVALVETRSVPRTSSGKVRRGACRDLLALGTYDDGVVIGRQYLDELGATRLRTETADDLSVLICGIAGEVCGAQRCEPTDSLLDLGADSLRAAEAAAVLQDAVGVTVPLELVMEALTPRRIAEGLVDKWVSDGLALPDVHRRVHTVSEPATATEVR